MDRSINLWEAITASEHNHDKFDQGLEPRCYGPKVTSDDVIELGNTGRWNGQELSLKATPEGWLIKVFSCYTEGDPDGVEILVPKDRKEPVKVLKDIVGRIAYQHD